jgi:hypothetical protein
MNDKEFYDNLDKLINELSAGIKHISLDYFNYNEVCMEITKRRKAVNAQS